MCKGTGKVQFSIPPIDHATEYIWTIPELFDQKGTIITTEPKINLEPLAAGSGTLSVSASNDCQVSETQASISVTTYLPLPKPELTISNCDRVITVSEAENYSLFVNDELVMPNSSETTLMVSDPGVYYITVENFCGIQKSNEIEAYPSLTSNVLIPNAITPNGDGINDFFRINKSLQKASVKIINRWGKSIYYSSDYEEEWGGDDVSPGTYYLVVRHHCLPQGRYIGWLTVVK